MKTRSAHGEHDRFQQMLAGPPASKLSGAHCHECAENGAVPGDFLLMRRTHRCDAQGNKRAAGLAAAEVVLRYDNKTKWGGGGNVYIIYMGILTANRTASGTAVTSCDQSFSYNSTTFGQVLTVVGN